MNCSEKNLRETVTPDLFLPMLRVKLMELQSLIKGKQMALTNTPAGRLRLAMCHGSPQWYLVSDTDSMKTGVTPDFDKSGNGCCMKVRSRGRKPNVNRSRGTYIPRSEKALVERLVQKNYDESVLEAAEKARTAIEKFISAYERANVNGIFGTMHTARQALTRPVAYPDEEFARMWESLPYEGKDFDGVAELWTARGERVRSKSEVIIADTLARLKIPYRYEFPHKMGRATFYPDFTCLNLRTRQEFIWEHFGLVEDEDYAKNMVGKMGLFAKNGFYPGANLITTSETRESPLDSALVRLYAEKYLL